jgi:outer membrane protein TolC
MLNKTRTQILTEKKIATFVIAVFLCTPLFGITIDQAIDLAKENNKTFLSKQAGLKQAEWNQYNSLTNFFPKISIGTNIVRLDDDIYERYTEPVTIPVFDITDPNEQIGFIPFSSAAMTPGGMHKTTYTTQLTLQQPIFNGGKVLLGHQIARLATKQTQATLQSAGNNLEYSVAETYLNILRMQDVLEISRRSLESSEAQLKKVTDMYNVGAAQKSDVLQWQVQVENNKLALNEVENSLAVLLTTWRNILGLKEEQETPSPETIVLTQYDSEIQSYSILSEEEQEARLQEVLRETEQNNADLRALRLVENMANKGYQLSKTDFLPTVNLQYTYQFENDDKLNFDDAAGMEYWNIAAVVSLPIFQSGKNYTNLRRSKYEYKKTELELADTQEQIFIGTKNSFYTLVTNAKSVNSNKLALEFARENHKIINDLYDQGMVTNTELIDAEIMLFNSEISLTSAYYDYILAKYNLEKFIK